MLGSGRPCTPRTSIEKENHAKEKKGKEEEIIFLIKQKRENCKVSLFLFALPVQACVTIAIFYGIMFFMPKKKKKVF